MKLRSLTAITAAAALLLAGCSSNEAEKSPEKPSAAASTANGTKKTEEKKEAAAPQPLEWTSPIFKDYTVKVDKPVQRVVADRFIAPDLMAYGITPVGVFGFPSKDPLSNAGQDLSGIPDVGKAGGIDAEKLSELKPDIIIGMGTPKGWRFFKEDVNEKLTSIAPFVPVSDSESVDSEIAQVFSIAAFAGAKKDIPALTKGEKDLADARAHLKKALEGKDLTIMLAWPVKDAVWTTKDLPAAKEFAAAGATVLSPEENFPGRPWGKLSWEQLADYQPDIMAQPNPEYEKGVVLDNPLWMAEPAVKENQVLFWSRAMAHTPESWATFFNDAATKIEGFKKITK